MSNLGHRHRLETISSPKTKARGGYGDGIALSWERGTADDPAHIYLLMPFLPRGQAPSSCGEA